MLTSEQRTELVAHWVGYRVRMDSPGGHYELCVGQTGVCVDINPYGNLLVLWDGQERAWTKGLLPRRFTRLGSVSDWELIDG